MPSTIPNQPAAIVTVPDTLVQRLQSLLAEEGFADAAPERTGRTVTFAAANGPLTALIHITVGKREKARPVTAYIGAPPLAASTADIVPTLPVGQPAG